MIVILCIFQIDKPAAPGKPKVEEIFKNSCVVSWTPPMSDGGAPITGYHLERRAGTSTMWVFVSKMAIKETSFKVTDLMEGNEYQFRVAAENKVGKGPCSVPSDPITAKDPWGTALSHWDDWDAIVPFTIWNIYKMM